MANSHLVPAAAAAAAVTDAEREGRRTVIADKRASISQCQTLEWPACYKACVCKQKDANDDSIKPHQ